MNSRDSNNLQINKVWLGGTVCKSPAIKFISKTMPLTWFLLDVVERWEDRSGNPKQHNNVMKIEVLGAHAKRVHKELRQGMYCAIEGYIRVDKTLQHDIVKIRVFTIDYEVNHDRIRPDSTGGVKSP